MPWLGAGSGAERQGIGACPMLIKRLKVLARSCTSAKSKGFTKNEVAPSLYAVWASETRSEPVSIATGSLENCLRPRIQRSKSNPSIWGMRVSRSTSFGGGYLWGSR